MPSTVSVSTLRVDAGFFSFLDAVTPIDTPQQLGRYELIRRLAEGGMGEIYLARLKGAANFEKRVVIKKILPHLAQQPEFVQKFVDEANILVQLTHGNIVPVFEMADEDGELYMAMEYIPGQDLRSMLRLMEADGARLSIAACIYIVVEVCKGLSYAHQKRDDDRRPLGIIHRDISPSNILLSCTGEVKIVDFGIAKASVRRTESVTGRLQGKFCYMSPEQARGAELDARSDIFSLGVVLYEMLTGVRPFEGLNDLDTLEKVREAKLILPGERRPEIPATLDAIVARALSRDPERRFTSADSLLAALIGVLMELGVPVTATRLVEELGEWLEQDLPPSKAAGFRLDEALALEADLLLSGGPGARTPSIEIGRSATPTASVQMMAPLTALANEAPLTQPPTTGPATGSVELPANPEESSSGLIPAPLATDRSRAREGVSAVFGLVMIVLLLILWGSVYLYGWANGPATSEPTADTQEGAVSAPDATSPPALASAADVGRAEDEVADAPDLQTQISVVEADVSPTPDVQEPQAPSDRLVALSFSAPIEFSDVRVLPEGSKFPHLAIERVPEASTSYYKLSLGESYSVTVLGSEVTKPCGFWLREVPEGADAPLNAEVQGECRVEFRPPESAGDASTLFVTLAEKGSATVAEPKPIEPKLRPVKRKTQVSFSIAADQPGAQVKISKKWEALPRKITMKSGDETLKVEVRHPRHQRNKSNQYVNARLTLDPSGKTLKGCERSSSTEFECVVSFAKYVKVRVGANRVNANGEPDRTDNTFLLYVDGQLVADDQHSILVYVPRGERRFEARARVGGAKSKPMRVRVKPGTELEPLQIPYQP